MRLVRATLFPLNRDSDTSDSNKLPWKLQTSLYGNRAQSTGRVGCTPVFSPAGKTRPGTAKCGPIAGQEAGSRGTLHIKNLETSSLPGLCTPTVTHLAVGRLWFFITQSTSNLMMKIMQTPNPGIVLLCSTFVSVSKPNNISVHSTRANI